jgi:hypothetical protein
MEAGGYMISVCSECCVLNFRRGPSRNVIVDGNDVESFFVAVGFVFNYLGT